MRLIILILLAVGMAAGAADANDPYFGCPLVIDDFTQGALPPANGPFVFTHVGLPTQSCLGESRRLVINNVSTHTAGMILLGGGDIGFEITTETHAPGSDVMADADVALIYSMPAPTDLTAGGVNDELVIDVQSVSLIDVFIYVTVPGQSSGKTIILQAGPNVIPLSDFLVDLTQVTEIAFYFNEYSVSGLANLTMSRIRVKGERSRYLQFEVPDWVEVMPPYLLPGPLMEAEYLDAGGTETAVQGAMFTLNDATVLPTALSDFPVELGASDSSPAGESHGLGVGMELIDGVGAALAPGEYVEFDFAFRLEDLGDFKPGTVTVPASAEVPDTEVFYVPFEVEALSLTSELLGTIQYRLRIQVAESAARYLLEARVHPPDPIHSPEFRVTFEVHQTGAVALEGAEGDGLFSITLEGDYHPLSAVTAVSTGQAYTPISLSALPNVTGGATQLHLSRGLGHPATIDIYAVSGRTVRSLGLAPGQQSIIWDGRSSLGRPVPSGLYFARVGFQSRSVARKIWINR